MHVVAVFCHYNLEPCRINPFFLQVTCYHKHSSLKNVAAWVPSVDMRTISHAEPGCNDAMNEKNASAVLRTYLQVRQQMHFGNAIGAPDLEGGDIAIFQKSVSCFGADA